MKKKRGRKRKASPAADASLGRHGVSPRRPAPVWACFSWSCGCLCVWSIFSCRHRVCCRAVCRAACAVRHYACCRAIFRAACSVCRCACCCAIRAVLRCAYCLVLCPGRVRRLGCQSECLLAFRRPWSALRGARSPAGPQSAGGNGAGRRRSSACGFHCW